jgi:hypothetical protein
MQDFHQWMQKVHEGFGLRPFEKGAKSDPNLGSGVSDIGFDDIHGTESEEEPMKKTFGPMLSKASRRPDRAARIGQRDLEQIPARSEEEPLEPDEPGYGDFGDIGDMTPGEEGPSVDSTDFESEFPDMPEEQPDDFTQKPEFDDAADTLGADRDRKIAADKRGSEFAGVTPRRVKSWKDYRNAQRHDSMSEE